MKLFNGELLKLADDGIPPIIVPETGVFYIIFKQQG
mgnify:CR=1 FL=1